MKKILFFIVILATTFINGSFAQNKHLRNAKRYEFKGDYVKSIISYQLYLENNKTNIYVYKKLADLSCKINDFNSAEMYCEKIINMNRADAETYFKYINILRRNSKYDESVNVYEKFKTIFPNKIYKYYRSHNIPENKKFYVNSPKINISDFEFNTRNSEFSPYIFNKDIYYSQYDNGNNRKKPTTKIESFINKYIFPFRPNCKIMRAKADTLSKTYEVNPFKKLFNYKYHEAIASLSPSGEIIYLSAAKKNERIHFGHSITGFDIYEARLINKKWVITQKIFDVPGKSFAHPCINRTCNMLYFASDIKGGYGGTDLYVSYLTNGIWSEPENLGPAINTPGNELYPYIDNDNNLYFSSDGHWGLGGLDIFVVSIEDGKIKVYNPGVPINSRFDDYGICCHKDNSSGLFSSNRKGGAGENDIYNYQSDSPLKQLCISSENNSIYGFLTLKGIVQDIYSNSPISKAELTLFDLKRNNTNYTTKTINGKFTFIVPIDGEYKISISADGYNSSSKILTPGKNYFDLKIAPKLTFPNIIFEYNSILVNEDGKQILNDIIKCLFKYPEAKISIKGYADIISEEKDKKELSYERAHSIKRYIENKGIAKNRITTESLGTDNPIITLDNKEAFEKEDAQALNRRVEVSIIHPSANSIKN